MDKLVPAVSDLSVSLPEAKDATVFALSLLIGLICSFAYRYFEQHYVSTPFNPQATKIYPMLPKVHTSVLKR